jgi:hypothetical protein
VRDRHHRGSASIEVVAAVPAFAVVALMGWYAAAAVVAAIDVQEDLRRRGLQRLVAAEATPSPGATTIIRAGRPVATPPSFPRLTVRGAVVVPAP